MRGDEIATQPIETVYLGGGTPSLWTAPEIAELYSKITSVANNVSLEEMTIECNPDDLTPDYLADLKRYTPVQRISIGIQSFHDDDLRIMNRSHNAAQARTALDRIFSVGFQAVSADLIFGLPNSTPEKWQENLSTILQYPIDHISCYNLTIEDRTALKYQLDRGKLTLPDDQEPIDQYYAARAYFTGNGFLHYEISNYGLPDHLAVHNTNYWKNKPYIGIGPSAHSYDGYRRRWNVADNWKYVNHLRDGEVFWETEELSEADRYNEYVMTGLRTMWGISPTRIDEFEANIRQEFEKTLDRMLRDGYITRQGDDIILTSAGEALADRVIAEFFYVD